MEVQFYCWESSILQLGKLKREKERWLLNLIYIRKHGNHAWIWMRKSLGISQKQEYRDIRFVSENKKVIFLYWVNLYSTFVFRLFMGIAWSGYKLGEHILSKNYNFFFFFCVGIYKTLRNFCGYLWTNPFHIRKRKKCFSLRKNCTFLMSQNGTH